MAVGNRGGRPKKPTALHLLNGNPSKIPDLDRRAAAEPHPMEIAPGAVPEPPEYMPEAAKECWRENAPMLAATHLLTVADLKALEAYCIMYANFRKMAGDLAKANMLVYKPHAATRRAPRTSPRRSPRASATSSAAPSSTGSGPRTPTSRPDAR